MVMSPDALMTILPDPLTEMSLPSIAIVPSFFIMILADPVWIRISSPALITSFLPTLIALSSPTLIELPLAIPSE